MELLPCWNMEPEVTYLHVSPAMVGYSIWLWNYLSCTPFEMKGVLSVWTKQMLQLQGVAAQLPSPRKSTKRLSTWFSACTRPWVQRSALPIDDSW